MKKSNWLVMALMASVCVQPFNALAGKSDDTLNIALDLDIESLDVYMTSSRSGIIAGRMVFDMLLDREDRKSVV